MKKNNYLVLAGGTGGHVIPAVKFGNYIIEKGFNCLLLVDQRGLKYTSSFQGDIKIIKASHFSHNLFYKFITIFNLIIGFFQASKHILFYKPNICISFGSYATFSPLLFLIIYKIFFPTKIYIHEQNSVIGRVNLLFSKFVNKIFLNFEKTYKINKNIVNKSFFVGSPNNYNNNNISNKKKLLNQDFINLFICGGSQGAVNLNTIISELLKNLVKDSLIKLHVSIQCPVYQQTILEKSLINSNLTYELKEFYKNFLDKLNQTDILISRSGAGTINDVILTHTPTIFVPLPHASDNHQYYNASFLQERNAALLIEQQDLNSDQTKVYIKKMLNNSNYRLNFIKNLKKIKTFDTNELMFNKMI